jgi:hypothetical protein
MAKSAYHKLGKSLIAEFKDFLESLPARRLEKHLRMLLLVYLQFEDYDGSDEQHKAFIDDIRYMFFFLDNIQELYDPDAKGDKDEKPKGKEAKQSRLGS